MRAEERPDETEIEAMLEELDAHHGTMTPRANSCWPS